MKLLYHPEKKSYRLLLRREQVHIIFIRNSMKLFEYDTYPKIDRDPT